jgi:hypothetical protein
MLMAEVCPLPAEVLRDAQIVAAVGAPRNLAA